MRPACRAEREQESDDPDLDEEDRCLSVIHAEILPVRSDEHTWRVIAKVNVQADDLASIIALCITVILVVLILRLTTRPWRQRHDVTLRLKEPIKFHDQEDEDTAEWPQVREEDNGDAR